MPTKMSLLIQAALFSVTASVCYAQDAIEVERKALAALTKVENYPAGVVKGSAVYAGKPYGKFHVHFRDSMYWLENDTSAVETEQDRKRILGTQEIMGHRSCCQRLPMMVSIFSTSGLIRLPLQFKPPRVCP